MAKKSLTADDVKVTASANDLLEFFRFIKKEFEPHFFMFEDTRMELAALKFLSQYDEETKVLFQEKFDAIELAAAEAEAKEQAIIDEQKENTYFRRMNKLKKPIQ